MAKSAKKKVPRATSANIIQRMGEEASLDINAMLDNPRIARAIEAMMHALGQIPESHRPRSELAVECPQLLGLLDQRVEILLNEIEVGAPRVAKRYGSYLPQWLPLIVSWLRNIPYNHPALLTERLDPEIDAFLSADGSERYEGPRDGKKYIDDHFFIQTFERAIRSRKSAGRPKQEKTPEPAPDPKSKRGQEPEYLTRCRLVFALHEQRMHWKEICRYLSDHGYPMEECEGSRKNIGHWINVGRREKQRQIKNPEKMLETKKQK